MVTIVGIRFKRAGKIYYFSPGEYDLAKGDHAIVETARGIEYGEVVIPRQEVEEGKIVSPLKTVIRKATEQDARKVEENHRKEKEAFVICEKKIAARKLDMHLSDPGNLAQGIINTTKQIVQTSTTAKNTLDGFMEAQKIFQQGKKYYDALKAVHDVVKGGIKVKKSIELVAEISEIYVRNYQNMLADPNYTPDELTAISAGYAKLLSESADVLQDLKNVVNVTGMSLTDAERLAVINNAYKSLLNYRNLVNYYTRKNISVSYLRAKKKNDTDRVLALYGSADERYW